MAETPEESDQGDEGFDDASEYDPADDAEGSAPAEVAAMHLVDESAGGFDSEVDDPALAEAYEIDPERER